MENFADLFEQSTQSLKTGFNPGEKVDATVITVSANSVFIDVHAPSEGIIHKEEFRNKDGEVTVKEGDVVSAYFLGVKDGGFEFTVKMSAESASSHLQEIYEAGIPVEGKVTGERNGGYTVKIGNEEAFCPFSQMDNRRGEPAQYIGQKFSFNISEYNRHNLVVSRRKILDAQAADQIKDLQYNLVEGDLITGRISKIMPFGAFVNLGGVDGLIPISELAWWRVEDVSECVKEGQEVEVKIIKLDWIEERITLSLKQAGGNPWVDAAEKFQVGECFKGIVTRLAPFGAFVQLERGIEGLVHISKLGAGRRINHPKEIVEEQQEVEVYIESVDVDSQRMSLSMEPSVAHEPTQTKTVAPKVAPAVINEGDIISGTVDNILDFGVFVKLNSEKTGLVHVSKIELGGNPNRLRAMSNQFVLGATVKVIVEEINGDKISLALEASTTKDKEEKAATASYKNSTSGMGSLSGMFDGLSL